MRTQLLKQLNGFFLIALGLLFITSPLHAAKVAKVSGKKVYLLLKSSENLAKGDKLLVYAGRKKVGLLIIKGIKGNKAVALLAKGKAKRGLMARSFGNKSRRAKKDQLMANKSSQESKESQAKKSRQKEAEDYKRNSKWTYGAVAGLNMTAMQVNLGLETVSASGTNFSAKGYLQYHWKPSISLMGTFGYEGFSSAATASGLVCDENTSADCTTSIQFLASEAWGQWYFNRGKRAYWIGGGMAFDFPLSKSSTSLNESDIGLTNFYLIGGGVDWGKIPIWFEYAMMPSTDTVQAYYISVKAGYSF